MAFDVIEHVGGQAGPTVALLGGVHGDEEEGVLAVQRVDAHLRDRPLARGTVRAVAVANPAAYAARRRSSPDDGLNLARCFPGDPAGQPTERLAHALTERVIRGSDLLIDLHSAGRDYAMPMFAGYIGGPSDTAARSRRAAERFAAPLVWEHPPPPAPGRTVSVAFDMRIASVYVEGSGGASLEADELAQYVEGVLDVLADLGMTASRPPSGRAPQRLVRGGGGDLDAGVPAPCAGRFVAARHPGDVLASGELIGEIVDDDGSVDATIRAPAACTLVFLRRTARMAEGDVVCSLGPPAIAWSDR